MESPQITYPIHQMLFPLIELPTFLLAYNDLVGLVNYIIASLRR
jgi:hypothetical protein